MSKVKVIKTEKDYKEALNLIEALMSNNADPESEEGEKLALLSVLVEDYESKVFPSNLPSPIDAIKFRMEQSDLRPVDLIPYIGNKSRVSEILSGKRKLTPEMMRALEAGLGIPAKVLLQKPDEKKDSLFSNWGTSILKEMSKRGYFGNKSLTKTNGGELIKIFFSTIGSPAQIHGMLRQANYRSAPTTDHNALAAWSGHVLKKAKRIKPSVKYKHGVVNIDFMQKVARLSTKKNSPVVAQEFLKKHGIILVIAPHLPKTRLDGAVILLNRDNPVIGLTLRLDRPDNFWFTLMHELAHISLHYNENVDLFYDELDNIKSLDINTKEKEADNLASEALVPANKWEISPARLIPSPMAADSLSKELGVHIAIIAGKIRHENGKWTYLNKIIGQEKISPYFTDEKRDKN